MSARSMTAAGASASGITEKEFQASIVELAHLCGWWVFHVHDSRRSQPGWPDLVLLRAPEAVFAEVKTDRGRVSTQQNAVIDELQACDLEVHVWRPRDWQTVERRLRRHQATEHGVVAL